MDYPLPRLSQQPTQDQSLSLGTIREEYPTGNIRARPESPIYSHCGQSQSGGGGSGSSNSSNGTSPDSGILPNKRQRINYECDACGTTYTEKRALARHRHTDMHRRRLGLEPDKRHTCLKCGRSFGRNHDLQRHRREQHGEATGASVIDISISCGASDGSEPRSVSSDDSTARSTSAASHSSAMTVATALTIPDEMPRAASLRPVRSHADFRTRSSDSQESLGNRMDWSHAPFKADADTIIRAWPGEPEEDTLLNANDLSGANARKPSRRHSSASLNANESGLTPDAQGSIISPPVNEDVNAENLIILRPSQVRPRRTRETVLKSSIAPVGRQKGQGDDRHPMTCMLCGNAFEQDNSLLEHLRKHMDSFTGKHRCAQCQVKFDHEDDLTAHLDSAKKGHCGFNFEHVEPCTGHHPPAPGDNNRNMLPDSDAFRFCFQLRNWEQAQLQAYLDEINELIASRASDREDRKRWSVEALNRHHPNRNSSHSFNSFAISVNTYASAPCDEEDGKLDIGGLQNRLKSLSLKGLGASVKHTIAGGKYHPTKPLPPPAKYDKTLFKAIFRRDLAKATALLDCGAADPAILSQASGTLIAAALWNDWERTSLLVAHRITEDISGFCKVCRMNSTSFNKGSSNRVRALLAHGADPNGGATQSKKAGGLVEYPILSASWMCSYKITKMLLHAGARVNQPHERFGSALGAAASQAGYPGSLEVVAVLLNYGAEVDVRGTEGTALEIAKRRRELWLSAAQKTMEIAPETLQARLTCTEEIIRALEAVGAR